MADTREKLVELLSHSPSLDALYGYPSYVESAEWLIEQGVTVQELGGCEYCKEDREGYRKMFGSFSITNPFHGKEWFINTGHCKPRQIRFCPMCGRKLTEPPKGE